MIKKIIKKNSMRNSILKYYRKERKKSYMELPIIKWYISLLLCAIGCFGISYFLFKFIITLNVQKLIFIYDNFFILIIKILQSCGAGVLTGMIVFVLGNVRSQAKENIAIKVKKLSNLYNILKKVYDSFPDRSLNVINEEPCNYSNCAHVTINAGIEYVEEIKKLDYFILRKFLKKIDFDFDEKKKELIKLKKKITSKDLSYGEAKRIRDEVIVIIQEASIWFEEQLNRVETQKQQIRTYPF